MGHIQIRISEDEKTAVKSVLDGMGLNYSAAIKLFFKQVVVQQKLPFEISANTESPKIAKTMQDDNPNPACGLFQKHKIG